MEMNKIDFDPALIGSISTRDKVYIIDFPSQYFYGEAEYGKVKCHCQIHIEDVQVIVGLASVNTKIDDFEIKSSQESRHCFLPEGYSVRGPVVYRAKLYESVVLEVKGNNLKLIVLSKSEQT